MCMNRMGEDFCTWRRLATMLACVAIAWPTLAGGSSAAQDNAAKAPIISGHAVMPYAVSTVRDSKGPMMPKWPVATFGGSFRLFNAQYITLRHLIGYAYGLQGNRIAGGPTWLDSKHFDITAKSDDADLAFPKSLDRHLQDEYTLRQVQLLLADRFHLKVHTEKKEIPVYALAVAKGGLKMKASDDKSSPEQFGFHHASPGPGIRGLNAGETFGIDVGMNEIVDYLSSFGGADIDRPLVDKSGLTGSYDFHLKWTPGIVTTSDQSDSSSPGLVTAIEEQLGLKLEARKMLMDVLVIDEADLPTLN